MLNNIKTLPVVDNLILVDISGECNFNCSYCNATFKNIEYGNLEQSIDPTHVLKNIKYLKKIHNKDIIILGGEPSIYPLSYNNKILGILKKSDANSIMYWTNFSKPIKYYNSLDGVDMFWCSLHQQHYPKLSIFFNKFKHLNKKFIILVFENDYTKIKMYLEKFYPELVSFLKYQTLRKNIDDTRVVDLGYKNTFSLDKSKHINKIIFK